MWSRFRARQRLVCTSCAPSWRAVRCGACPSPSTKPLTIYRWVFPQLDNPCSARCLSRFTHLSSWEQCWVVCPNHAPIVYVGMYVEKDIKGRALSVLQTKSDLPSTSVPNWSPHLLLRLSCLLTLTYPCCIDSLHTACVKLSACSTPSP